MPGRTHRKARELGAGRSLYIAMPRAWCDAVGVVRGTRLTIVYGSVLVVVPPGNEECVGKILERFPAEVP